MNSAPTFGSAPRFSIKFVADFSSCSCCVCSTINEHCKVTLCKYIIRLTCRQDAFCLISCSLRIYSIVDNLTQDYANKITRTSQLCPTDGLSVNLLRLTAVNRENSATVNRYKFSRLIAVCPRAARSSVKTCRSFWLCELSAQRNLLQLNAKTSARSKHVIAGQRLTVLAKCRKCNEFFWRLVYEITRTLAGHSD